MIWQFQLRSVAVAVGLVAGLIIASAPECAYARGRGGFPRGGFSREGAAAGGSFASHSGFMAGHERGFESGARGAEFGHMGEANRMEEGAGMAGHPLEPNREQAAKALQNSAQQYRRAYPYAGAAAAWDAGAAAATTGATAAWGAAAATGAAIGSAAAVSAAPASTPAYAAEPCPNAVSVPVGPLTFFRCGTAWYRQAYGPSGPTFVQVERPGL